MNTKFLEHFGKWGWNTGFVIFMTPPSGKLIVADHDPRECLIVECKAGNTSTLKDGRAEVWFLDGRGGPFFCDVKDVFLTRLEAETRLSDVAKKLITGMQADIDTLKSAQQQLKSYVKGKS